MRHHPRLLPALSGLLLGTWTLTGCGGDPQGPGGATTSGASAERVPGPRIDQDYLTEGPLLLTGVAIVDGLGNPPQVDRDLLVQDGRIAAIGDPGQVQAPEGVTRLDGTGLTVLPGLIDMHYHLKGGWTGGNTMREKYPTRLDHAAIQQSLAALLYAGVTTALDLGSDHDWIVDQKARIDAGEYIAPRYEISGVPISQSPSGWDGAVRAETVGEPSPDSLATKIESQDPEVLGALLDRYLEDDIRIIKLYSGVSALGTTFLIKEAEKRGMIAVADLWQLNMSADWMRMTGLHGWAHASPYEVSPVSLKWMADHDKFIIATANVGEKLSGLRVAEEEGAQLLLQNPLVMDIWGEEAVRDFYASYPQVREELYEGPQSFYQIFNFGDLGPYRQGFLDNIRNAHEAGILVAGGTDAPAYPSLWSGETMHRELELFVQAGIDPVEAIQMCTHNGARILGMEDRIGSVVEGMEADLLVVEGRPWENISDTRNVQQVLLRGQLLDREALLSSWKEPRESR